MVSAHKVHTMQHERERERDNGIHTYCHGCIVHALAVYSSREEGDDGDGVITDQLAVRYRRASSAASRVRRRIDEAVVLSRRRSAEQVARGRRVKAVLLLHGGRGHQLRVRVHAKHRRRRGRRPRQLHHASSMRRESAAAAATAAGRAHADRQNQRQAGGARCCCRREQHPRRTHGRWFSYLCNYYTAGGSIVI